MSSIFTKLKDVGEAILDIGPKVVPCISNFGKVKHTKTELVKLSAKIATQLEKDYGLKGNVTDNLKAFISDSITMFKTVSGDVKDKDYFSAIPIPNQIADFRI
ncbi:MAG: hypothetical protein ACI8ZF_000418 [Candidatus Midichloriaceae bacterium]|jgi:hypothetical protein